MKRKNVNAKFMNRLHVGCFANAIYELCAFKISSILDILSANQIISLKSNGFQRI